MEEGDIVSPRLEWDLDACQACNLLCPRPGRVDDERCIEIASGGADARHALACYVDGGHFAVLNQRPTVPFGGFEERIRCESRVGVTRVGFVGGEVEMVGD